MLLCTHIPADFVFCGGRTGKSREKGSYCTTIRMKLLICSNIKNKEYVNYDKQCLLFLHLLVISLICFVLPFFAIWTNQKHYSDCTAGEKHQKKGKKQTLQHLSFSSSDLLHQSSFYTSSSWKIEVYHSNLANKWDSSPWKLIV